MIRKKILSIFGVLIILTLAFVTPLSALAQEEQPVKQEEKPLTIYTQYPSRIISFGEMITVPLRIFASNPQTVWLEVLDLPEGWTASFRGGSQIIDAVYINGEDESSVDLRLEPPASAQTGKFEMRVLASGRREKAEVELTFNIEDKLPARLSLEVNGLPTKRGTPTGTFSFTADLKNEGDEDLLVSLSASQPENMQVNIQSSGQDITELELPANQSKSITIKADPFITLDAGKYPFTVVAEAGDLKAQIELVAEVVGEGKISVSGADGRLSGQAYAGQENPLKIVLTNNGSAPLRGIELSSSEPNGWSLTFDQSQIAEIPIGESVEVNAKIKPPQNAVAGDYMITINARPIESKLESAEFRITVRTSTLWGLVGIGLVALAVAVVGIAVVRFGRR